MKSEIDLVKESKEKARRHRDNWKHGAHKLKKENEEMRKKLNHEEIQRLGAEYAIEALSGMIGLPNDNMDCTLIIEKFREMQKRLEWQPIETAPKDGTQVLLLAKGPPECPRFQVQGAFIRRYTMPIRGVWESVGRTIETPTHWMPLPTLPKQEGGK